MNEAVVDTLPTTVDLADDRYYLTLILTEREMINEDDSAELFGLAVDSLQHTHDVDQGTRVNARGWTNLISAGDDQYPIYLTPVTVEVPNTRFETGEVHFILTDSDGLDAVDSVEITHLTDFRSQDTAVFNKLFLISNLVNHLALDSRLSDNLDIGNGLRQFSFDTFNRTRMERLFTKFLELGTFKQPTTP